MKNESNFESIDEKIEMMKLPVGFIMMTIDSKNPAEYLGYGTWVQWGKGRVPVGVDTAQTEFNAVEKADGYKTHTLNANEMPYHNHGGGGRNGSFMLLGWSSYSADGGAFWVSSTSITQKSGGSGSNFGNVAMQYNAQHEHSYQGNNYAHNNLQPYITCYMWKRES